MAATAVSSLPVLRLVYPSSYGDKVMAGFSALQEQNRMTDFTIKTKGGKSIKVHKMLLAVASDYFSAMFASGMKEARDGEVHLNDLSEKAVCDVVDSFYGREISIELQHLEDYLDVIEIFQFSDLKKEVEECIKTRVDASSAIHWYKVATKYNLQEVIVKAKSIIKSDFYKAFNAYALDLSDMLELLQDKDLMSVPSDLKFKVVIAWVQGHENERPEGFSQLVDCIELEKCSLGYLSFVLATHQSLLMSAVSVTSQISNAVASGLAKGKHLSIGSKFTVIGGLGPGSCVFKNMLRIDMNAGTVEDAGEVPDVIHRWHPARCTISSGALFSVSGGSGKNLATTLNDCVLFDPDTMAVTHLPPPPEPRMCAGAAAIGTKLYFLGGYNHFSKMSCLDLLTEKWSDCADLIHGVCYPIVCTIGKYIFVLTSSGIGGGSCYNEGDPIYLQCYDSDKDEWTLKASPPSYIKDTLGTCAVAVWTNMYIVGGSGKVCISYNST